MLICAVFALTKFLSEEYIFAPLPLRWRGWQVCLIIVCPAIVFIVLAVWDLQVRLLELPLVSSHVGRLNRGLVGIILYLCNARLCQPGMVR
jgi:hypothetical protein